MDQYKVTEIHEPQDNSNHWLMQLLDRPIAYHRIFAKITGSVTAGVMLSQAFYWSKLPTIQNRGGWFYKSATEWEEETCLSAQEQRTARKRLSNFEWWQEDKRKANGAPTIHYRINLAVFTKELAQFAQQMESADSTNPFVASNKSIESADSTNPINRDYTETTTYILPKEEERTEKEAIFDVLEKQWLMVNPAQLEQHLSLSKKYGFENWLRGWTATQPKHRANATYVEKVVISNMPDDEAATAFGFIKTNRARNPIQQADGSVTVEYENKTLIVPEQWVHHLGTEKEEQILSALLTRRAINNER